MVVRVAQRQGEARVKALAQLVRQRAVPTVREERVLVEVQRAPAFVQQQRDAALRINRGDHRDALGRLVVAVLLGVFVDVADGAVRSAGDRSRRGDLQGADLGNVMINVLHVEGLREDERAVQEFLERLGRVAHAEIGEVVLLRVDRGRERHAADAGSPRGPNAVAERVADIDRHVPVERV